MSKRQKSASWPTRVPRAFCRGKFRDAYERGWNWGHGLACHNVPTIGDKINRCIDCHDLGYVVTAENVANYHSVLCHEAADHGRCFSPWEFTAAEFNASEDHERLWEAYEAGTADSIAADLATYTLDSYAAE